MRPESTHTTPARVVETHVSHLFLVGDRAYKLKKPVRFGFVDLSSREARERACRREVELNRRLAPDVYLGVLTVVDEAGVPLDHLVAMRRMPAERRLATLVRRGADVEEGLGQVARALATLHASGEVSEPVTAAASRDAVLAGWEANFTEMRPFAGEVLDPAELERGRSLARAYLAGRERLFQARIATGQVREGHGDLLAEDIFLLDDGPRILDCIEFDDRLRRGDVLWDAAFLAMDLERLGRPELGRRFLDRYQEFWGHPWPRSLADHYIAYRAQVRSKVACLRHGQDGDAAQEARQLLHICLDHLERGTVRLVLVGGTPGTGKSTLARGLAEARGWILLRSDEVRKELADLPHRADATAPYRQGLYRPEHTAATYRELLQRARTALEQGESAVIDASWSDRAWRRAAAEVATETTSTLTQIRCTTSPELATARIAARRAAGTDPSDATPELAVALAEDFAAWPEATIVDTSGTIADSLRAALSLFSGPAS
ncbi:MAG TPA: AAA family ATPase [Candidatus Dormibacteraeota bacterium]|nr:AAA family ATPase [Candidatus Dormibacteraeota bacterium]